MGSNVFEGAETSTEKGTVNEKKRVVKRGRKAKDGARESQLLCIPEKNEKEKRESFNWLRRSFGSIGSVFKRSKKQIVLI